MTAPSTAAVLPPAPPQAPPAAGPAPEPLRATGLRLLPAPTSAPPYDDELAGDAPVLRLVPSPKRPHAAPPGAVDGPDAPDAPDDVEHWLAASRTPTAALPAVRGVARSLVQAVLEVLAGVRPLRQLQRDTSPELYARLQTTLAGLAAAPTGRRPSACRPDARTVRSLHVQERPEGVVEVCATVVRDRRAAALALRLEGLDGRWRCTELAGV